MRIARAFAAVALLMLPATVAAAEWWWVRDSDRVRSMVERSSIARSGSWATAWRHDFYLSPRGLNLFSARYLIQHDCARREATVLSAQAYDGEGRTLSTPVPDRGSLRADDLREVCANDWSRATRAADVEGDVRMWRLLNDN
jgi:hypothetical protein